MLCDSAKRLQYIDRLYGENDYRAEAMGLALKGLRKMCGISLIQVRLRRLNEKLSEGIASVAMSDFVINPYI